MSDAMAIAQAAGSSEAALFAETTGSPEVAVEVAPVARAAGSGAAAVYAFEPLEPTDPPARDAAARALAQAATEAEELRERARAEGYEEGRRAGHADGAAEVARSARALAEAASAVHSLQAGTVQAVESDAIDLGLRLAERILAGTLAASGDAVVEVVRGALALASERRNVTVLLNPADLPLVRGAVDELTARGGIDACELRPDDRVAPGGAIARTEEGEIDASVHTQLERAREVVEHTLAAAEHAA